MQATTHTMPLAEVLAKLAPLLPLKASGEQIQSTELNDFGNWIVAGLQRDLTPQDHACLAYLAHAANVLPGLVEAITDLLDTHPRAATYPDGPCIDRETRKELVALLAAAQTVQVPQ